MVAVLIVIPLLLASPSRTVLASVNALPYNYLPWDNAVPNEVTQGNNNPYTHNGTMAYAWDFGGSWEVRAARGGKVTGIKENSTTHCGTYLCQNDANYVVIDTLDGYETLYLHLAYGSVTSRVYLGQQVDRYMPIGVSDTTGFTDAAHLHYQVQDWCQNPCWFSQSRPSSFLDQDVLLQDADGVPKSTPEVTRNQTVRSGNFAQLPRVAVTSGGPGRVDFFVRGTNLGVWHRYQDSTWHPWESLGSGPGTGYFVGQPSATSWGANRMDVFGIGGDGNLWHRYWDGTSWNPAGNWENLLNRGRSLIGTPSAAAWGVNKLSVVARNSDFALEHWSCTGPTCQWDTQSHGGWFAADPIAISAAANSVDVVGLGNLGRTYHQSYNGTTWLPGGYTGYDDWVTANNGSAFVSQPTAASYDSSHVDAFNVSADRTLWTKHYNGSSWGGWQLMGNPPGSLIIGSAAPVDSSTIAGIWSVFVRDSTGAAWNCWWNGTSCNSPWDSHGGTMTSEPATISVFPSYQLDLFVRGSDSSVWHRQLIAPSWSPWESLGGAMT
jgi:murein DD-endopeptidase MepM/ murein hydrolase activator NlpD